ncbi:MAG: hypothetical protein PVH17_01840 [Anaerolineae bacterium]|jgi:hypothetical protein
MEEIEEATPVQAAPVDAPDDKVQKTSRNVGRTIGIVAAVVIILAIIGGAGYGLVTNPPVAAVLRDIFIIVLALVTIIIGLFLAILIFQLQSLITLLRDEIKPILESANDTVSTVRGTTTFVSDAVVHPMIKAASYASAVRRTVQVLTGSKSKKDRSHTRRQDSQE